MSATKIQDTLIEIQRNMMEIAPYRGQALFDEFLVNGYTAITLSSVSRQNFSEVLRAKVCLGTMITLYDDFADRPTRHNPRLLDDLYRLKFGTGPQCNRESGGVPALEFANSLFAEMEAILAKFPNYHRLVEILNFDLAQFYLANQFSSLVTTHPSMNNALENRLYTHHNMGMIMAGMMDLIATDEIEFSEFGTLREVFLIGQRMGRIFNVLATRQRENQDGDITGELATCKNDHEIAAAERNLRLEIRDLADKIRAFENRIKTFSVSKYLTGLIQVQQLHEKMEGII